MMITFHNLNKGAPYQLFKERYDKAIKLGQKGIEAISISSYNSNIDEIDSRYVNLKFISDEEFIFFTNYNSPKASAFSSNNHIAALMYWPSINTQIRIKAKIKKTSYEYNQKYFSTRSKEKNALAISSNQSQKIESFNEVEKKYKNSLENKNLKECPKYWGGYAFKPFEIEFWEGNEFRLNKRNLFKMQNNSWKQYILEP